MTLMAAKKAYTMEEKLKLFRVFGQTDRLTEEGCDKGQKGKSFSAYEIKQRINALYKLFHKIRCLKNPNE